MFAVELPCMLCAFGELMTKATLTTVTSIFLASALSAGLCSAAVQAQAQSDDGIEEASFFLLDRPTTRSKVSVDFGLTT